MSRRSAKHPVLSSDRFVRRSWHTPRGRTVSFWQRLGPPHLLVGSFILLIAVGTLGLKFLPGLYTGKPLSWGDALFTATSAACVTGLAVVDTGTYFTVWGQGFLLLLIQLGGLGMLAFSSLFIMALGKRLSVRAEMIAGDSRVTGPGLSTKRLTLDVILFTITIEALGAGVLWLLWSPHFGAREAIWPAVFHSVSAFCNAGFSTFSDSLIGFQKDPASLGVISLLIVAGGIGFLAMEESVLSVVSRDWRRRNRLSLHTRIVLATTFALLVGGAVLFYFFEAQGTLAHLPQVDKISNSCFMSVTARTAGFNSIDYAAAGDSMNFLTILLMLIGGSPGSTAGGLKTTTFALIGLLAWSRFRSDPTTSVAGRSIPEETIQRATGLLVVSVVVVAVGLFALTATDPLSQFENRFLIRLFEVCSAFGTVGLSMGVTDDLSPAGKAILTLLMLMGRVGPLTLAASLVVNRSKTSNYRFAYEDVVVG